MTNAAFFLVTRTLANAFRKSAARLRNPRYIAGAALAALYVWSFAFRRGMQPTAFRQPGYPELMSLILAAIALVILLGAWALPGSAPGLVFTEAEIQFFFAGPVSRRQLLAYKMLRSQLQSLFSAFIFSVFVFRRGHFIGMWVVLAVLDVYLTFVSFVRARLELAGIRWWWRAAAVSFVATAIGTLISGQVRANAAMLSAELAHGRKGSFIAALSSVLSVPPLSTVLYVPRLIGSAIYAASPWMPMAIVLMMGAAFFFATTQIDIGFEDASIVASQRALARRARMRGMRSGRSAGAVNRFPPPFRLGETGRPEVALIWKNMIGAFRMTAFPLIAVVFPLVAAAIAGVFHGREGVADMVGIMGLMSTAVFVFLGPQAVRTDLRTDVLRLDVIKTYPLSAESLLLGELGGSLVVVASAAMLLLLTSVAILQFAGHYVHFATTPEFVVSAIVFIIPISAIQLLIQNGAIVLFPAWNLSSDGGRFSAMGQRLLFMLGNLITMAVALLPAAVLFIPAFVLLQKLLHHSAIATLIATIPALAVLVGEIVLAHKFLAGQFEDIDIANDIDSAV